MDAEAGLPADKFVISTLVCILKPTPATDIVYEDRGKIGGAAADISAIKS
jgi:hypothetical protein